MNVTKTLDTLLVVQIIVKVLNGIKETHNGLAVHADGRGIRFHDGKTFKR